MADLQFNPMDAEFIADPYPMYHRLRTEDPVHHSALGFWVLTRYEDVVAALRDPRLAKEAIASYVAARFGAPVPAMGLSMLDRDPPDHTRLRGLVSRAFTPRTVEGLRGRVEAIVQEHLDAVADQGGMDVMASLAYPLPVIIIGEMLGVPREDQARFKHWSDEMVRGMGMSSVDDSRRSNRATRELRAYLEGVASARRREPREDLLSALLAVDDNGERLSDDDLYETCSLLLVAGHETTTNLIGNGLLALLRNPEQL